MLKLQRGGVVRTLEAKGVLRDTSTSRHILDGEWSFVAAEQGGKDVRLDLVLKHGHKGEHVNSLYKATLGGSLLPTPLTASMEAKCTGDTGHHHSASILYGERGVRGQVDYDGSGLASAGKPVSIDINLELLLQTEKYKTIQGRLQAKGSDLNNQMEYTKGKELLVGL